MKVSVLVLALGWLGIDGTSASKCKPSPVCTADIITDGGFSNGLDDWSIITTGTGAASFSACTYTSSGNCAILSIGDGSSSVTISRPLTLVAGATYTLSAEYSFIPTSALFSCTVVADTSATLPDKRSVLAERIVGTGSTTADINDSFQAPADTSTLTYTLTAAAAVVQVGYIDVLCP
ncbi:hypothetical protein SCUCBS95973_007406 [Sporothrix curviconia]|uniref:CBM-cenC domain-containing protein n=1 Tax=Sporothrix curviconia TaxID=1260050 RepID=A0ABP0CEB4_9PEZI